jgi:hypothetical protein
MAKRSKTLPARKRDDDDSLLLRSAESLGRMIGSLQRQLDGASKRWSDTADEVMDSLPAIPGVGGTGSRRKTGTKKRTASKRAASRTRKTAGTRPAARKTAGARKGTPSRRRTAARAAKKR